MFWTRYVEGFLRLQPFLMFSIGSSLPPRTKKMDPEGPEKSKSCKLWHISTSFDPFHFQFVATNFKGLSLAVFSTNDKSSFVNSCGIRKALFFLRRSNWSRMHTRICFELLETARFKSTVPPPPAFGFGT